MLLIIVCEPSPSQVLSTASLCELAKKSYLYFKLMNERRKLSDKN
jgi:hypothetical protein